MYVTRSLKKNNDFRQVYGYSQSSANHLLVLYVKPNCSEEEKPNRLGVSVSRKVGKAVVRNWVKRLIKESYRLTEPVLKRGYDIVVVARATVGLLHRRKAFEEINRSLVFLLKKKDMIS
jgi:ribonuclease P protein component